MASSRISAAIQVIERVSASVWGLTVSPYTALALLVALLTVTTLRGTLPQPNADVTFDVAQYSERSSLARSMWSGVGSAARSGEALRWAMRAVLGLVAALSLLRMLQLWVPLWVFPPRHAATLHSFSLSCDLEGAWQKVSRALALGGQRLGSSVTLGEVQYARARRLGIAAWAPGTFYLGVLALLAATLIEGRYGWVGPTLELALGETRPLNGSGGLAVRLEQIELIPRADGTMQRFNSRVSLVQDRQIESQADLTLGVRAAQAGVALYQLGYGPAVRVAARDREGRSLELQRVVGDTSPQSRLRVRFSDRQQEQLVVIPSADLIVRLIHYPTLPAQGIAGRALHVQLRRGTNGQLLAEQFLAESGTVPTRDAEVTFAFEYFVLLRAEREPALAVAAVAGGLILLGMTGWVFWPFRELWVAVREDEAGCTCQLAASRWLVQSSWFQCIKAMLSEGADE